MNVPIERCLTQRRGVNGGDLQMTLVANNLPVQIPEPIYQGPRMSPAVVEDLQAVIAPSPVGPSKPIAQADHQVAEPTTQQVSEAFDRFLEEVKANRDTSTEQTKPAAPELLQGVDAEEADKGWLESFLNTIYPSEKPPALDKDMSWRTPAELVSLAITVNTVEPAIQEKVLQDNVRVYLIYVTGKAINDPGHRLLILAERESALDKQLQHIRWSMEAGHDKSNKMSRWLNLGGTLSAVGMVAGYAPALVGGKLKDWFEVGSGVQKVLETCKIWGITDPRIQKDLREKANNFMPGLVNMPTQYAHAEGAPLESKERAHQQMAQTLGEKAGAASGRKRDLEETIQAMERSLLTIIDATARADERSLGS
jgi:hypothetical protein